MNIKWHEWHPDITVHVPHEDRPFVKYIRESKDKMKVYIGFRLGGKLVIIFNSLTKKWEKRD